MLILKKYLLGLIDFIKQQNNFYKIRFKIENFYTFFCYFISKMYRVLSSHVRENNNNFYNNNFYRICSLR